MMAYTYAYPHPAVTTDVVVIRPRREREGTEAEVLLIRRGGEPYKGMYALPGGFLNEDEDCEECARRELREETGIEAERLTEVGTWSSPKRDPRERVISVVYATVVGDVEPRAGDDAAEATFVSLKTLPKLAFDHEEMVRDALERLRSMMCRGERNPSIPRKDREKDGADLPETAAKGDGNSTCPIDGTTAPRR